MTALRALGEPAYDALLGVLEQGPDERERAGAAALLGALGDPRAFSALRAVLDREDDVLLRRAAARGIRLLGTPEAAATLGLLVAAEGEDRLVRLSAAYGLAEYSDPRGVVELVRLFEESEVDGQGRFLAFRALAALRDERALPLMRRLTTSAPDASYRREAIRFLAEAGDAKALPVLDGILRFPAEPPSILQTAREARDALAGRR